MRSGTKIIRLCVLLAAFMALSAMAGCPNSSDFQSHDQHTDGPPDHSGPGAGMGNDGRRHGRHGDALISG